MTNSLQRWLYPAALIVLITAFHWRITLSRQYDWMWGPDLARQVLPWYEEEARQFQHAIFPAWDPHEWGGQPLLAQGQPGASYPLNWLLFLAPRRHGHISVLALSWYLVAIHWMAGLFCYLLCRDLRLSRFASLTGGLVFALGGYVGSVGWPQMLNGAVWGPLVFLFLLRAVRGERPLASASLCGVAWGLSWLGGHHQAPMFISMAAGFTWVAYILRRRPWKLAVRLAGLAVIACTFMFLTGALLLLPAREYGRLAKRWVSAPEPVTWNQAVPYSVHAAFSLSPVNLVSIVVPWTGGNCNPFIGILALTLAGFAVATAWERREVKLFTALAIGGFAYALGLHDVFQGVLYAVVPMLNVSRTPAMALVVFSVGVAALAAYGAGQLVLLRASASARRTAFIIGGFGLAVAAIQFGLLLAKSPYAADSRPAMMALLAILGALLLFAWVRGALTPRTAAALLILSLMIDLGTNATSYAHVDDAARMTDLRNIRDHADVAQFLNRQSRPFRVEMETEDLPVSWPAYNDFDEIKSSVASITVNRVDTEFWTPQNRSLMGVRFTIGFATAMPDAKEVFRSVTGLKVFENPHAFPRAWAVHELIKEPALGDGWALIREHLDEMRSKAFTLPEGAAPLPAFRPCASPDSVTIASYRPEYVSINANLACDGMVVLSDTFYPGWKASVDGKPTRIYEVNVAMRGVAVAQGAHLVEYRYAPASVALGGALTASGILGACFIAYLDRRRRS